MCVCVRSLCLCNENKLLRSLCVWCVCEEPVPHLHLGLRCTIRITSSLGPPELHSAMYVCSSVLFPPPAVRVLLSLRALPGRRKSFADSLNKNLAMLACLRRLQIARYR